MHQGVEIVEQGNFLANLLKLSGINVAGIADDIGGGFGLSAGAVVDDLGLEAILVTAETPIAEVVFVKVSARFPQFFDDGFVGEAVIEHAVDFRTEGEGQASDLAVATGFGLAGLELA